ncbi:hypothetical protein Cgig2_006605 [Carnegiea gigantea]|uniref:Uncharacterized protein n=1 Tax=Carnegiea gigantea TaxID=171969 RepID=A0A9Q1KPE7_9CARY|nr:hypothetical protein Cgig2_006605 [Carnegiea gigantea]
MQYELEIIIPRGGSQAFGPKEYIKLHWKGILPLMPALSYLADDLVKWNKDVFGNLFRRKQKTWARLEGNWLSSRGRSGDIVLETLVGRRTTICLLLWDKFLDYLPREILNRIASYELFQEDDGDRLYWKGDRAGKCKIKSVISMIRNEPTLGREV